MRRDLAGQRILITGASSGIGRAIAVEAGRRRMRLAITARSADPLNELASQVNAGGGEAYAEPADVTLAADRQRLFQTVVDRLGGLDVLVSNAGIGTQGLFSESSEELLRQVMEVNFFAPVEMIRLAVPLLQHGRQPAIVQISSMTGRRSMPFWTEYSASKFAICGFIEAMRAELVRYGIDVLLIIPGVTQTNLGNHLLHTDGKIAFKFEHGMPCSYVARKTLDALQRNRAETVLGWEARWVIRANRFLPRLVDFALARYVRQRFPDAP
jgi:short-subunit dehydrogenase